MKIPFTNIELHVQRSGDKRSIENPSVPLSGAFGSLFGASPSASGISVTEMRSVQLSTVYACVRIIAETVASLPGAVFKINQKTGTRQLALQSDEYCVIFRQPNEMMSSFTFREAMCAHVLLWGNAYAVMERRKNGQLANLLPVLPWTVVPRMEGAAANKNLIYELQYGGGTDRLPTGEIIHVPGLSFDGIVGMAPIRNLRNAIGLAIATEEYGSRFFANDARPGIAIEVPGVLQEEQRRQLKESLEEAHAGLSKKWRAMVMEAGMKIHEIGIPPQDAQFLETRKFQVSEIARIFRVPLPLLQEIDKSATYASVEQFGIQFIIHTIRPWLIRFEQEFNRKLWPNGDYEVIFNADGLMRGDFKSRMEGYQIAVGGPWMTTNEARAMEGLDAAGPAYDDVLRPLNMGTPAQAAAATGKDGLTPADAVTQSPGGAAQSGEETPAQSKVSGV